MYFEVVTKVYKSTWILRSVEISLSLSLPHSPPLSLLSFGLNFVIQHDYYDMYCKDTCVLFSIR